MKKMLLLLTLIVALGGLLSAQETHENVLYAGTTDVFGLAIAYEKVLFQNFNLLIDAGIPFFPNPAIYIKSHLRWFPFSDYEGKTVGFFLDAGAGFGAFRHIYSWLNMLYDNGEEYRITGLILSPGFGFKFGSGKRRGLVFSPSLNFDIYLGGKEKYLGDSEDYNDGDNQWEKSKFGVGFSPNLKLLFGFAF